MERNYREEQHKRIVAISVAVFVFGLAAILRLSGSLFGGVSVLNIAGKGDDAYLLSACVLMLCAVAVILARSIQDNRRGRHAERHDPLTGLPNRENLIFKLKGAGNAKAESGRGELGTILLINPHRIGSINVSMGHEAGDAVMRTCSERLNYLFPEPHIASVSSKGVFAVYLDGVVRSETIRQVSAKIDEAFSIPVKIGERAIFLSKSTGAAIHSSTDKPEVTLRRAELALLEAKSTEKREPVLFNRSLEEVHSRRGNLETEFAAALENDALDTWLQPLVGPDGKTLRGFEALARWIHPERGMISPGVFVPIAEKLGLTDKLGRTVLRKACIAVKPLDGLCVSVNVTATHLLQDDFVDQVQIVLEATGFPAERLELELTETVVLEEKALASRRISALRAIGVRIALDDFGTGYSGLSYLNRFEIDRVKIDASFVGEIGSSVTARETIASVVALARKRGCAITAEGVETGEQLDFLSEFGDLTLQGYLFGHPVAPGELADLPLVRDFNLARFKADLADGVADLNDGNEPVKTRIARQR